jgi:hypothetical protein
VAGSDYDVIAIGSGFFPGIEDPPYAKHGAHRTIVDELM